MIRRTISILLAATAFSGCSQMVYVPPGTSVEIALARRAEVTKMPPPPPGSIAASAASTGGAPASPRVRNLNLPAVEPVLPTSDTVTAVAEAFTRGNDALQSGQNDVAINAFQQAVQIDPKFSEAWQKLAMAYEKAGKPDKAKDAYRHSKEFVQQ